MSRKEKWQLFALLCAAICAGSVLIISVWVIAKLSTEGYLS